jgi:ACR3 family arsenite transporter
MTRIVQRMEHRQVPLYLAAIAVGALAGWWAPAAAPTLSVAITPVLALLLFATFLGVPLGNLGRSVLDLRFFGAVLGVNFLILPVLVFGLSRFVADDRVLLLGVLLVLLTPCVDYVIVFTSLAGGARDKLLAATPVLMLLQLLLLPVYLLLLAGPDTTSLIEVGPFVEAFLLLIVLPLAAAAGVQWLSRRPAGRPARRVARGVEAGMHGLMVPLMMLTLAVVVGSQVAAVGAQSRALLAVVPIYLAFLVVMVTVGVFAARLMRLEVPAGRALVFSGATRNSLVVLPLALALPDSLALVPLVVVTQTLIELVGMVVLVRLVPRLVPHQSQVVARE